MEHLLDLRLGNYVRLLRVLRDPLTEHFRQTFPNVFEDSLAYNATNRIIEELRPFVEEIFQFEEAQQSRVNLVETVLNITKTAILRIINYILNYRPSTKLNFSSLIVKTLFIFFYLKVKQHILNNIL